MQQENTSQATHSLSQSSIQQRQFSTQYAEIGEEALTKRGSVVKLVWPVSHCTVIA